MRVATREDAKKARANKGKRGGDRADTWGEEREEYQRLYSTSSTPLDVITRTVKARHAWNECVGQLKPPVPSTSSTNHRPHRADMPGDPLGPTSSTRETHSCTVGWQLGHCDRTFTFESIISISQRPIPAVSHTVHVYAPRQDSHPGALPSLPSTDRTWSSRILLRCLTRMATARKMWK